MNTRWRLPRGVDELLPPHAWRLEQVRRHTLNLLNANGFEYIEPPVIEYLDALLVGSGEDMDLQTLKVVDQVSGKQMGVRADMTSQAVRIDAHSRMVDGIARLCYAGPVVFANPQIADSSRVPFKAGAEIFGSTSIHADAEVVRLMLEVVQAAGVQQPVLCVGHMGIYRGLVDAMLAAGDLAEDTLPALFKAVQRKAAPDIQNLVSGPLSSMMVALPTLMAQIDGKDIAPVMAGIRSALSGAPEDVIGAVDDLQALITLVTEENAVDGVRVDVSELSGYGYHNGPVFAVYHPTQGSALAQGGRYDGVGEIFGRARAATGFDVNLKALIGEDTAAEPVWFAPFVEGDERLALLATTRQLRADGKRVVVAVDANEQPPQGALVLKNVEGTWQT